jgi:very-short-patch-repair endonuclease
MRGKHASDAVAARVAARQHGVITLRQLGAAGFTSRMVETRVRRGTLHRIHRGVYAVGHPGLSGEGSWMAAVLACGKGAVLSHRAAGALWRITTAPEVIDVTVPGNAGRGHRDGIRIHRSSTLALGDCTARDAIPVTKPARTLEDLRRTLPPRDFAAALREAEFLRLPIGDNFEPDHTRTELESRFLALCRRYRLPKPEVNVRVGRFKVDFLWRDQRLVVEVDGWESHRTRSAFEDDRARDARLKLLGYTVIRFTWRQLTDDPGGVAATVRALL